MHTGWGWQILFWNSLRNILIQKTHHKSTLQSSRPKMTEEIQTGMGLTTFDYNNKKPITLLTDNNSATSAASRLGVNRHFMVHDTFVYATWWIQTYDNKERLTPRILPTSTPNCYPRAHTHTQITQTFDSMRSRRLLGPPDGESERWKITCTTSRTTKHTRTTTTNTCIKQSSNTRNTMKSWSNKLDNYHKKY